MYTEEHIRAAQAAKCKWLATDSNGYVWGYNYEPTAGSHAWRGIDAPDSNAVCIDSSASTHCSAWRESLRAIPELVEWKGPPKPDASGPLTPYVDLLARLAHAINSGKLPINTFEILRGIEL